MGNVTLLFVDHFLEQWFCALDSGTADLAIARHWIGFQPDLGKEGRHLVVLVLRPTLERMIVAFVAIETNSQEQMSRVLHRVFGGSQDFEVGRRWVVVVGSRRGQNLSGKLVIGTILDDRLPNPLAEFGTALRRPGTCD